MSKPRADNIVAQLEAMGEPFEHALDCPWLEALEHSYGVQLPEPFRSLVENYRWAEFDAGPLNAFSNLGRRDEYDLLKAPFADKAVFDWLKANGLIQIGRLATGAYDPVCLNLASSGSEPSIVSVDHEDILLCRKKVYIRHLSASLESMVHESAI